MSRGFGAGGPDVELLADLDAGLLDDDRARQVRAAASVDTAATAVLNALAATRAELAGLPTQLPPPAATARWAAALDAARRPAARKLLTSTRNPDHQPRRRQAPTTARRCTPPRIAAGLLTLLIGAAALWPRTEPTRIAGLNLAAAGRSAVGSTDLGALADPIRRAGCLRTVIPSDRTPNQAPENGVPQDPTPQDRAPGHLPPSADAPDPASDPSNNAAVIGGRQVELDGRPGVLLVLTTGRRGVFHVVVVDPACGPEGGTLLGATTVGR